MSLLRTALLADPELDDLLDDRAHLAAIVRFEVLLAQASTTEGLVPADAADEIHRRLSAFTVDPNALSAGFAHDGVVVPSLLAVLRASLSAESGRWLHHGATSQDAIDTAWALQLASVIPIVQTRLAHLNSVLDGLAVQVGSQPLMAHTRMQAALPFTLADKLASWQSGLSECMAGIEFASGRALAVQLGGPVGNRASFDGKGDAIAGHLARLTGLGDAQPWHSNRMTMSRLGAELAGLSGILGKIGADIALMAQTELGQATIAGGGGSSAMAHKHNPVAAELLVTLARHSAGSLGTLYQAMVHENERSGAAWTLEWMALPDIVRNAGAGLRLARRLLEGISFPPQHLEGGQ